MSDRRITSKSEHVKVFSRRWRQRYGSATLMRGKSPTCRKALTNSPAVYDRSKSGRRPLEEVGSRRQVRDLPRIGVAEPDMTAASQTRGPWPSAYPTPNSLAKFSLVTRATSITSRPCSIARHAAVSTTRAGSFRFPRKGTGVR